MKEKRKMSKLKLRKWNELTEEVIAPPPVMFALMAGRTELLIPHEGAPEETKQLYNVIRVLMETNQQLQEHCQSLAREATELRSTFKGVWTKLEKLKAAADFTTADDEEAALD
jgi:predicted RNase H-like nuclease (RuvC/YqgF family)